MQKKNNSKIFNELTSTDSKIQNFEINNNNNNNTLTTYLWQVAISVINSIKNKKNLINKYKAMTTRKRYIKMKKIFVPKRASRNRYYLKIENDLRLFLSF